MISTPVIDPPELSGSDPITVTITTETEGATIYYTLDGSTPTEESTLYTGPFTVENPEQTTVRAIAVLYVTEAPITRKDFDRAIQRFRDPNTGEPIPWDSPFFERLKFTLSYYPELNAWASFHDYDGDAYFYSTNTLFSSKGSSVFRHNVNTKPGEFYGEVFESMLEYVDNREPNVSKTISGLFINSEVFSQDGLSLRNKTFSFFQIRNTYQDTGKVPIQHFIDDGNARYAQGFWRINQIRNAKDEHGNLLTEQNWFEKQWLSDRYHYVKLSFDNSQKHKIYLISSELNIKASLR